MFSVIILFIFLGVIYSVKSPIGFLLDDELSDILDCCEGTRLDNIEDLIETTPIEETPTDAPNIPEKESNLHISDMMKVTAEDIMRSGEIG